MILKARSKGRKCIENARKEIQTGDKLKRDRRKNRQSGIGNKGIKMTQEEISNKQRNQIDIPERFKKQTLS
jgi:hypothetical protein